MMSTIKLRGQDVTAVFGDYTDKVRITSGQVRWRTRHGLRSMPDQPRSLTDILCIESFEDAKIMQLR